MDKDNIVNPNLELDEQSSIRREKLVKLRSEDASPYDLNSCEVTHHSAEIIDNFDQLEEQEVKVAGRVMSKRGMGKVSFVDLHDRQGKIQIFTKIDVLGEEKYQAWQNLDLGDVVQVTGHVFRTKRGEISIRTTDYLLLAKCLRPLPEKFHGLQDLDTRYRKRYLDLVVNPQVKTNFFKRSQIITSIRNSLLAEDFLEVETPLLNTIAHGADARPFLTHHNTLDLELHLRISPELYLKRLIVGGFERVFEIGRNFRNEGMSYKHNPEFTMVEIYQAYADYEDMMKLTEKLISQACLEVNGTYQIEYQGTALDLTPPFRRLSMKDAVKEYADVDFDALELDDLLVIAKERGIEVAAGTSKGQLLSMFFDAFCEDKLIQPTFIYDYPVEISPLSKQRRDDKSITERFELFIKGTEYGNAYSELNDPEEQLNRFMKQYEKHRAGDEEACLPDYDYIEALEYGMPPTGGLGIGIDRLVMLLTDSSTIRDVLLFPTMKPLNAE